MINMENVQYVLIEGVGMVAVDAKNRDKFMNYLRRKEESYRPSVEDLKAQVRNIIDEFSGKMDAHDKKLVKAISDAVSGLNMDKSLKAMGVTIGQQVADAVASGNKQVIAAMPREVAMPEQKMPEIKVDYPAPARKVSIGNIKRNRDGIASFDMDILRESH